MSATPLTGLKVLEFSHTVMGPTAGLVFAELGADVVKAERVTELVRDHDRELCRIGKVIVDIDDRCLVIVEAVKRIGRGLEANLELAIPGRAELPQRGGICDCRRL